MRNITSLVVIGLLFGLAACSKSSPAGGSSASNAETKNAGAAAIERFYLPAAPEAPAAVLAAKKSIKSGDVVILEGRVKEWVDGLAAFTLVDSSLRACSDPGDAMQESCKTPWDYCCIAPDEQRAAQVTVEFRDGADPIAASLAGFHGIDHLVHVVVRGKATLDSSGNVVVVADGIHVKKS